MKREPAQVLEHRGDVVTGTGIVLVYKMGEYKYSDE